MRLLTVSGPKLWIWIGETSRVSRGPAGEILLGVAGFSSCDLVKEKHFRIWSSVHYYATDNWTPAKWALRALWLHKYIKARSILPVLSLQFVFAVCQWYAGSSRLWIGGSHWSTSLYWNLHCSFPLDATQWQNVHRVNCTLTYFSAVISCQLTGDVHRYGPGDQSEPGAHALLQWLWLLRQPAH